MSTKTKDNTNTDSCTIAKMKKRKKYIVVSIFAIIILLFVLMYIFPIYRIAYLSYAFDHYNTEEIKMVAYRGSFTDRAIAHQIIKEAENAFSDCGHSMKENQDKYGELAIYATPVEHFENAHHSIYSIDLWSAHFGKKGGSMWVCYSQTIYDSNGNIIYECLNTPSLWTVEKTAIDKWTVINVNTHP